MKLIDAFKDENVGKYIFTIKDRDFIYEIMKDHDFCFYLKNITIISEGRIWHRFSYEEFCIDEWEFC